MLNHEYFEELSAAASVGQASAEELAELERHAADCYFCQKAYLDYVSIAAHEFVAAEHSPSLSLPEAQECLDSDLFARRFFDRAEREGIVFSEQIARQTYSDHAIQFPAPPLVLNRAYGIALVSVAIFVLTISAIYQRGLFKRSAYSAISLMDGISVQNRATAVLQKSVSDLQSANRNLENRISLLNAELAKTNSQLASRDSDKRSLAEKRLKFESDHAALEQQLLQARRELDKSHSVVTSAQQEAEVQEKRAGYTEATLVATQIELSELSQKLKDESSALDKERDLLAMEYDVSNLMGARNLHILDVMDTDSRGKLRPAFGRIFFTEGKSLVFYAYDFNEAKIQKANYQYQVWAKKEGQNRPVRKLGIFYSDDKAQHRWVFKCDDPKILQEIDSVFVTLGRPNSDPYRPEGSQLMHAYLRGIPNHP